MNPYRQTGVHFAAAAVLATTITLVPVNRVQAAGSPMAQLYNAPQALVAVGNVLKAHPILTDIALVGLTATLTFINPPLAAYVAVATLPLTAGNHVLDRIVSPEENSLRDTGLNLAADVLGAIPGEKLAAGLAKFGARDLRLIPKEELLKDTIKVSRFLAKPLKTDLAVAGVIVTGAENTVIDVLKAPDEKSDEKQNNKRPEFWDSDLIYRPGGLVPMPWLNRPGSTRGSGSSSGGSGVMGPLPTGFGCTIGTGGTCFSHGSTSTISGRSAKFVSGSPAPSQNIGGSWRDNTPTIGSPTSNAPPSNTSTISGIGGASQLPSTVKTNTPTVRVNTPTVNTPTVKTNIPTVRVNIPTVRTPTVTIRVPSH